MSKKLSCNICGNSFANVVTLRRHLEAVHDQLNPHQCEVCYKSFFEQKTLKNHVSSVHEKLKPSQCEVCFKSFAAMLLLKGTSKLFTRKKDLSYVTSVKRLLNNRMD
jgi:uncharacterized Zn-finger protein